MFLHSMPPAQPGKWALKCLFNCISRVFQVEIGFRVARSDGSDANKNGCVLGSCLIRPKKKVMR